MAQVLSPLFTDSILKIRSSPSSFPRSGKRWRSLERNRAGIDQRRRSYRRGRDVRIAATAEGSAPQGEIADDYYAVLGLLPDATPQQIKKAYYNCMKACHPDLSGNDPDVTNFCMFINEIYEVLSDPVQRMVYDEIHGYALTAINPFFDDTASKDHAFVDEFSCIGCKNCANLAPDVFGIEEDFGRARVYSQCGKSDLVQQAIDSCPVDCIHWTSAAQLSLLEDEMRRVERVNVGLMLAGMGASSFDVFRMAVSRWEKRQMKVLSSFFFFCTCHCLASIISCDICDLYCYRWKNLTYWRGETDTEAQQAAIERATTSEVGIGACASGVRVAEAGAKIAEGCPINCGDACHDEIAMITWNADGR